MKVSNSRFICVRPSVSVWEKTALSVKTMGRREKGRTAKISSRQQQETKYQSLEVAVAGLTMGGESASSAK